MTDSKCGISDPCTSPLWPFQPTVSEVSLSLISSRLRLKCGGKRAETRFLLSAKRTSPFKSAGASGQSTTGSRGVRISGSNAGYTMFRGSVRVLATHSIRQFPLHFSSRASPYAIRFQLDSTNCDWKSVIVPLFTNPVNNILTPRSRVLLEKLTGSQLATGRILS
jgi:hypothetical protein